MGETCVANYASMHFVPRERIKFCNKKKKKETRRRRKVSSSLEKWNLNTLPFRISIEENEKVDGRYCGLGGIEDGA